MEDIVIVRGCITLDDLKALAKKSYGHTIKGVVDIENEIVAFGGQWHSMANAVLIENGSKQTNVWGFNVLLLHPKDEWIECISLVNIRPLDNNTDMEVQSIEIREKIKKIVNSQII